MKFDAATLRAEIIEAMPVIVRYWRGSGAKGDNMIAFLKAVSSPGTIDAAILLANQTPWRPESGN